MKELFSVIGLGTVIIIGSFICGFIVVAIKECVEKLKYHHKVKHRFDKPPTAKCYCKDCKYHGDNGKCYDFTNKYTADNWFCCAAERKCRNGQEKA